MGACSWWKGQKGDDKWVGGVGREGRRETMGVLVVGGGKGRRETINEWWGGGGREEGRKTMGVWCVVKSPRTKQKSILRD